MSVPPRIAFSTLAFPHATLASAASLGRRWGYTGIELRLIDGELIDSSMPAARRAQVKRILAGLPVVAVDSSIRLTGGHPGPELRSLKDPCRRRWPSCRLWPVCDLPVA